MTLGLNQHLVPSAGGGDDGLRVGGPDEGFGIVVVLGEVAVDRGLEIDQRVEYATLQAAPGELGEEALDGIEPGSRGWREVEGPARVASEPVRDKTRKPGRAPDLDVHVILDNASSHKTKLIRDWFAKRPRW